MANNVLALCKVCFLTTAASRCFTLGLISNFQVSSLVVESCADLVLNLDLRGLNLSSMRTVIRDSHRVVLETVLADYRNSFAQTYHLAIKKVKNATLSGVELVSSVRVSEYNLATKEKMLIIEL